ncbi:MAG: hypothetical protein FWC26_15090 [Fibromonadales bacterium]|nr:hypothetical protein [Fibromonadales bacterium]
MFTPLQRWLQRKPLDVVYAIKDLNEATMYLQHELLCKRFGGKADDRTLELLGVASSRG